MNLRYSYDLDIRLHELNHRRRILESQYENRLTTYAEYSLIRSSSMSRLCDAVAAQNEQARLRNKKLLEDVSVAGSRTINGKSIYTIKRKASAEEKLKEAKEVFFKRQESAMPSWHRIQAIELEEKLRKIRMEKILSEKRKEQLREELIRENRAKFELERSRQDLLISLAEEQRYVMEANANAILLQEEAQIVDAVMVDQIAETTDEMRNIVRSNITKLRQDGNALRETSQQQRQQQQLYLQHKQIREQSIEQDRQYREQQQQQQQPPASYQYQRQPDQYQPHHQHQPLHTEQSSVHQQQHLYRSHHIASNTNALHGSVSATHAGEVPSEEVPLIMTTGDEFSIPAVLTDTSLSTAGGGGGDGGGKYDDYYGGNAEAKLLLSRSGADSSSGLRVSSAPAQAMHAPSFASVGSSGGGGRGCGQEGISSTDAVTDAVDGTHGSEHYRGHQSAAYSRSRANSASSAALEPSVVLPLRKDSSMPGSFLANSGDSAGGYVAAAAAAALSNERTGTTSPRSARAAVSMASHRIGSHLDVPSAGAGTRLPDQQPGLYSPRVVKISKDLGLSSAQNQPQGLYGSHSVSIGTGLDSANDNSRGKSTSRSHTAPLSPVPSEEVGKRERSRPEQNPHASVQESNEGTRLQLGDIRETLSPRVDCAELGASRTTPAVGAVDIAPSKHHSEKGAAAALDEEEKKMDEKDSEGNDNNEDRGDAALKIQQEQEEDKDAELEEQQEAQQPPSPPLNPNKTAVEQLSLKDSASLLQHVFSLIEAHLQQAVSNRSSGAFVREVYTTNFSIFSSSGAGSGAVRGGGYNALFGSGANGRASPVMKSIVDVVEAFQAGELEEIARSVGAGGGVGSGGSGGPDAKSAESVPDRVLGETVLAVVQTRAADLIPSEAFSGVVTLDKLRKEYKRVGPPGVQQLWDALAAHLQAQVAANSTNLSFLSMCFTNALVTCAPEDDRERLHRKVSKLLQLAMIPSDKSSHRSPSPPYRNRAPISLESSLELSGNFLADSTGSGVSGPESSGSAALSPALHSGPLPTASSTVLTRSKSKQGGGGGGGAGGVGSSNANKYTSSSIPAAPAAASVGSSVGVADRDSAGAIVTSHLVPTAPATIISTPIGGSAGGYSSGSAASGANKKSKLNLALGASINELVDEYEYDEIEDEEAIAAPPPIRDLDALQQQQQQQQQQVTARGRRTATDGPGPGDEDEFDF